MSRSSTALVNPMTSPRDPCISPLRSPSLPQVAARFLVVVDEDDRIETLYTKAPREFHLNRNPGRGWLECGNYSRNYGRSIQVKYCNLPRSMVGSMVALRGFIYRWGNSPAFINLDTPKSKETICMETHPETWHWKIFQLNFNTPFWCLWSSFPALSQGDYMKLYRIIHDFWLSQRMTVMIQSTIRLSITNLLA